LKEEINNIHPSNLEKVTTVFNVKLINLTGSMSGKLFFSCFTLGTPERISSELSNQSPCIVGLDWTSCKNPKAFVMNSLC
jgi:hypothetical protein